MAFIPHTPDDIARMLEVIGVQSIDDLFDEIPRELRAGALGVPPALERNGVRAPDGRRARRATAGR